MDEKNELGAMSAASFLRTLWREKNTIALVTGIIFLLSLLASMFLAKNEYTSKSAYMISNNTDVTTVYGTYSFPTENIGDYIKVMENPNTMVLAASYLNDGTTANELRGMSEVEFDAKTKTNVFTISSTAKDPAKAQKVNSAVGKAFMAVLRYHYMGNAIDKFKGEIPQGINNYKQRVDQLGREVAAGRKLLATMKPSYSLKELFVTDPALAQALTRGSGMTQEEIIDEKGESKIINTNFFDLEAELLKKEAEKITNQESIITSQKRLDDLNKVASAYSGDQSKNITEELEKTVDLDVMRGKISQTSASNLPSSPDRNMKVIFPVMGLVLGFLLGVLAAYFRAYMKAMK